MSVAERRARERAELTEKIIDAARALFAREGYEAVTLRRIAEAIEYSPATVYGYFADKEALIRSICERDFESLAVAFGDCMRMADPVARIRALGAAYIRFAVEHPNHYRLMFMTPKPVQPDEVQLLKRGDPTRDGYAALRMAVAEAVAAGRYHARHADADLLAQTLWAAVHGVASLQISMGTDVWVDWRPLADRMGTMLDAIENGLVRPSGAPS